MKNLNRKQKNNLIIGGLCCILLLMGIGYAAFSTQLKINGTSSISSEWKVLITDITSGSIVGDASNAAEPTHTETTATFSTNLVSPGDSITYTITVANQGSIDATLSSIDVNTGNNDAIEFETSGIEEGDNLLQGASDELYVKVTYSNSVTSQPTNTTSTITVTLNYEQSAGGSVTPSEPITTNDLKALAVTEGDGLYADSYEEGRYIYKGANPNNYITFNNEKWQILSVENDGSLKIVRGTTVGLNRAWDATGGTYGSNNWARPADLNTYLNEEYYEDILSEQKNYIIDHEWNIGKINGANRLEFIYQNECSEKWIGKIGLASVSEILNSVSNCDSNYINDFNDNSCYSESWLTKTKAVLGQRVWLISGFADNTYFVYTFGGKNYEISDFSVSNAVPYALPVLYLSSDITLTGSGTWDDPYVIS